MSERPECPEAGENVSTICKRGHRKWNMGSLSPRYAFCLGQGCVYTCVRKYTHSIKCTTVTVFEYLVHEIASSVLTSLCGHHHYPAFSFSSQTLGCSLAMCPQVSKRPSLEPQHLAFLPRNVLPGSGHW
jgi:hypothetical protein